VSDSFLIHQAKLVADVVIYLLRQGYSKSIAVLTPYLKQLSIIQKMLNERAITVVLDDRDIKDLDELEDEEDPATSNIPPQVKRTTAATEVICRTIDNYQGRTSNDPSLQTNSSSLHHFRRGVKDSHPKLKVSFYFYFCVYFDNAYHFKQWSEILELLKRMTTMDYLYLRLLKRE
jgi:hypothetical protein